MRNLIFLLFISLAVNSFSQLEFVGEYETGARLIYLSRGEPAIFIYDQQNEHIELYNLDLTLIDEFDIPVIWNGSGQYNLHHVSRSLFDCDESNIEYLISNQALSLEECYVQVIRDDGTILFDLPEHIFVDESVMDANPALGTAMISDEDGVLFTFVNSMFPSATAPSTLYRSCGSIPGSCPTPCDNDTTGVNIISPLTDNRSMNLFPNPGNDQFTIEYSLSNNYASATLMLFNLNGQLALQRKVGPSMHYILVNTSELSAGQYEVVLVSEDGQNISESYVEVD